MHDHASCDSTVRRQDATFQGAYLMDSAGFTELLDYYRKHLSDGRFVGPLRNRLDQISTKELEDATRTLLMSGQEPMSEHASRFLQHLVDYCHRVDSVYDQKKKKMLTYALSLAGFCATYITFALN